jgi:enoyl-CoA hydratase/carnithine racemase
LEDREVIFREEGPVATIVINRPEKRNALTAGCLAEMTSLLRTLSSRERPPVVVLRGAGDKSFCAGYDISELPGPDDLRGSPPLEETLRAIEAYPYPVLAMIKGQALGGGCELAVACDLRFAGTGAVMGMPPAKLGLVYPYQGYRRFLRTVGLSRTAELFFTGRRYNAQECLALGLVNRVIGDDKLEAYVYDTAVEISENAPLSIMGTKTALRIISSYPTLDKRDEDELNLLFLRSISSKDMAEAKKAFLERRKPLFRGF